VNGARLIAAMQVTLLLFSVLFSFWSKKYFIAGNVLRICADDQMLLLSALTLSKYWLESASKALVSRIEPSLDFARAALVRLKSEDQEHKCLD
jgi:hypothetical protein